MKKSKKRKTHLDFTIDKLTRSIENVITGESFATEIFPISKQDLKQVSKKNGWLFNWKKEYVNINAKVFKLVTVENMDIIQGLLSITVFPDRVFMNLIENAPFNRTKTKIYNGVAGNLVAYACKVSFASGGEGFLSFYSKTKLIEYYSKSLGARHEGGHLMVIYPPEASKLVKHYFKN